MRAVFPALVRFEPGRSGHAEPPAPELPTPTPATPAAPVTPQLPAAEVPVLPVDRPPLPTAEVIPLPPEAPTITAMFPPRPEAPAITSPFPGAPLPPELDVLIRSAPKDVVEPVLAEAGPANATASLPPAEARVIGVRDCSGGQPPLSSALPPVPAGHPCYVTKAMVAEGSPLTDRTPYIDIVMGALSICLAAKNRRWFRTAAARPEFVSALIATMSGGIWNLVNTDYGTVRNGDGSYRPSQGYGLGQISEKWLQSLYSQRTFLLGDAAKHLGTPSPSVPSAPYAAGPLLVNKETAPFWFWLYMAAGDAALGNEISCDPTVTILKQNSSKGVAQAHAILAQPETAAHESGLWWAAWFRYGSRDGAAAGIITREAPVDAFLANLRRLA